MLCPKCNGKTRVVDNVKDHENEAVYRKRLCTVCGHEFFTSETIMKMNVNARYLWYQNYRKRKK